MYIFNEINYFLTGKNSGINITFLEMNEHLDLKQGGFDNITSWNGPFF